MTMFESREDNVLKGIGHSWGRRLRVAQRFVQGLAAGDALFHYAPAIVIATESYGRAVVDSGVVKCRAHLIDGNPTPDELDIGEVAGLADSGNVHEFAARYLDSDGADVGSVGGERACDQGANGIDSERA